VGEALRVAERFRRGVEELKIHLVLPFAVVAPGEAELVTMPGEIGADRCSRGIRHAARTGFDGG